MTNPAASRFRCPICEKSAEGFLPFGVFQRPNAQCPWCKSLERHRLVWSFFSRVSDLFDGEPKRVLHIAPELAIGQRISRLPNVDYLSADIDARIAMVAMDVTNIQFEDDAFDVIYCSHVLEHVLDDRKAMRELARVLKPSGWAVLQVPVNREATFEDPTVVEPEERLRVFGYPDHVRIYGRDYVDRLTGSGFDVEVYDAADFLSEAEVGSFAVSRDEEVFFCKKAVSAQGILGGR